MSKFKLSWQSQLVLAAIFLLSLVLYFLGKQIPAVTIQNFVESTGAWGPVVFILAHSLSIIVAPISGLPFLVAGFYLFGEVTIVYMYLSANVGFVVNFYVAKKWGRAIVVKLIGHDSMARVDKLAREYGVFTLIFLRLLWGGIADYVSYAYGLTQMKFKTYITVSFLATIPGQLFWYYIASKTLTVEQFLLATYVLTFTGAGIFLAGRYLARKGK